MELSPTLLEKLRQTLPDDCLVLIQGARGEIVEKMTIVLANNQKLVVACMNDDALAADINEYRRDMAMLEPLFLDHAPFTHPILYPTRERVLIEELAKCVPESPKMSTFSMPSDPPCEPFVLEKPRQKRNAPCDCHSGKKYKNCHYHKQS